MDLSKISALLRGNKKVIAVAAAGATIIIASALARWWLKRDNVAHPLASIFNKNSASVRRVTPSDAEVAAVTLGAAFNDDPLICAMTELQQPARAAASRRLYEVLLRAASPASRGLVVIGSESLDAVALWMPPCE